MVIARKRTLAALALLCLVLAGGLSAQEDAGKEKPDPAADKADESARPGRCPVRGDRTRDGGDAVVSVHAVVSSLATPPSIFGCRMVGLHLTVPPVLCRWFGESEGLGWLQLVCASHSAAATAPALGP